MYFTVPPSRPLFWPLGGLSLPRRNSRRDPSKSRTSDEDGPEEEGCIKITPDNSLNVSFNGPTPPSKCILRRNSLPRSRTESSSSSSDTIKHQVQAWSNLKLNTSSESELDVRGLLLQTPRGAPVFSSRLVREFRDNYDSPDAEAMPLGDGAAAAHVLRQAHWKYPSPSATKKKSAPGMAGSPDTATTAPPSFSIDEHYHDQEGDGAEEGDISAITTDHEHNVLMTTDDATGNKSEEHSPPASKVAPPTLRASHLRGLRQLLWPEAKENSESNPSSDFDHRSQHRFVDETYGPHNTATMSTSIFTGSLIQQVTSLTCCGALMTAPIPPQDRAFASRSDEDSHLIMESSGSSLLNLDDDEDEEEDYDASRSGKDFKSIFRSRELKVPMKELSKVASLVSRCTRRTFDGEPNASATRTGDSALEDTINWDFLSLHTDAFVDDDDGVNKSGLSSHASDHLFNEFLTLDDSTVGSEPAMSEASIATAPRKNIYPDDTVSTTTKSIVMEDRSILMDHQPVFIDDRPVFMGDQPVSMQDRPAFMKEPEDGDEDEPPALHLSERARQVLLNERMKFQY